MNTYDSKSGRRQGFSTTANPRSKSASWFADRPWNIVQRKQGKVNDVAVGMKGDVATDESKREDGGAQVPAQPEKKVALVQRIPDEQVDDYIDFCEEYNEVLVQRGNFVFVPGDIHSQAAANAARQFGRDVKMSDLPDSIIEHIATNNVAINDLRATVRISDEDSRLDYESASPAAMNGEVDMAVLVKRQNDKAVLDKIEIETIIANPVFYVSSKNPRRVDATANITLKACIQAALMRFDGVQGMTGYEGWWDIEEATPDIDVNEIVNASSRESMKDLLEDNPKKLAKFLKRAGHPEFENYMDGTQDEIERESFTIKMKKDKDLSFVEDAVLVGPVLAASRMLGDNKTPRLSKVIVGIDLEANDVEEGEDLDFTVTVRKLWVEMKTD